MDEEISLINHPHTMQFRVIKVPEFIAKAWLNQPAGTQIGTINEPKSLKQQPNSNTQNSRQPASKKQRKDNLSSAGNQTRPDLSSSSAKASISISVEAPVRKIHSLPVTDRGNEPNDGVVISLSADPSSNTSNTTMRRPHLEGIVSASQSYLPDVIDPQYLEYLASRSSLDNRSSNKCEDDANSKDQSTGTMKPVLLSVAETNSMQKRFMGFDDNNNHGSDARLFKYFNTSSIDDMDEADGHNIPGSIYSSDTNVNNETSYPSAMGPDGGLQPQFLHPQLGAPPQSVSPGSPPLGGPMAGLGQRFQTPVGGPSPGVYGGQSPGHGGIGMGVSLTMSYEEAQEKLFHLFEAKGAEGVNFKDIQQNVKMAPVMLKKLLDQIAEPQRERLGKRTVFVLKSQYRVMK